MDGANTAEVQRLLARGRARLMRATMEVLEARAFPSMPDDDIDAVRATVRSEIDLFHESMSDLVGQVVDESVVMSPEVLEFLTNLGRRHQRTGQS